MLKTKAVKIFRIHHFLIVCYGMLLSMLLTLFTSVLSV